MNSFQHRLRVRPNLRHGCASVAVLHDEKHGDFTAKSDNRNASSSPEPVLLATQKNVVAVCIYWCHRK